MKKPAILLTAMILCIGLLAGCGCKHEWIDADCLTPKTCSLCGETEGEPLEHDFVITSCTVGETCTRCGEVRGEPRKHNFILGNCTTAKTCARCKETEGEPLGHAYDRWEIQGENMSRSCATCGNTEEVPVDREVYMMERLTGFWDFSYYMEDGQGVSVEDLTLYTPAYLSFEEDGSAILFTNSTTEVFTAHFSSFKSFDQYDAYYGYFAIDENPALTFAYCDLKDADDTVALIHSENYSEYFGKNDIIADALVELFGAVADGMGYTPLTMAADHTFTADFGGSFSGHWGIGPVYNYTGSSTRFCTVYFAIDADDGVAPFKMQMSLGDKLTPLEESIQDFTYEINIKVNDIDVDISLMSDWECTALKDPANVGFGKQLYRQWQSARVSTFPNGTRNEKPATDYSITFSEDGTFTAMLDEARTGTWELTHINIQTDPCYQYRLYFDGVSEQAAYTVASVYGDGECSVSFWPNGTQTTISFLSEERLAARAAEEEKAIPRLLGDWNSFTSHTHIDGADAPASKNVIDYVISFAEDGTFTATLNRKYTGTWTYLETDSRPEDSYTCDAYALTVDGIPGTTHVSVYQTGNADADLSFSSWEDSRTQLNFRRISEKELEAIRQNIQQLLGTWRVTAMQDFSGEYVPIQGEGETITFYQNFTYSSNLGNLSTGYWYHSVYSNGTTLFTYWVGNSGIPFSLEGDELHIWFESSGQITSVIMKKD